MALVEFYLSQARLCDDAARVSIDPKIIKSLQDEAVRFRALAANHANQRDPYTSAIEESRHANQDGDASDREGRNKAHVNWPRGLRELTRRKTKTHHTEPALLSPESAACFTWV